MKALSEGTSDLVRQLWRVHASVWRQSRALRLVEEIERQHEPAAISALVQVLLGAREQVARRAATAVRILLGDVPDSDLECMDRDVRSDYTLCPRGLELGKLDRIATLGTDAWAVFAVLCSYRDGYVRERALRHLSNERSGGELRFLLLRANDWVEQVRTAAYEAIRARLEPGYATRFAASAGLVGDLGQQSRIDHSALVTEIARLLGRPECEGAVEDGLRAIDFRSRRLWYRIALSSAWADRALALGFDDEDPVIRIRCAECALRSLQGELLRVAVDRMLLDPHMPVRRRGLRAVASRLPDRAAGALRSALLDRSGSIRDEARWHLSKESAFDAAAFYRDALTRQDAATLPAALHGLCEVGTARDAGTAEAFLAAPAPKVRAAALRAFARLSPQPPVDRLLAALADPSGRVSRLAARLLYPHGATLDPSRLAAMLEAHRPPHVREGVLRVLESMPRWEGGTPILRACGSTDDSLAAMARGTLDRWLERYNRSFDRPSATKIEEFREALDGARLDAGTRRQLEHIARSWATRSGS